MLLPLFHGQERRHLMHLMIRQLEIHGVGTVEFTWGKGSVIFLEIGNEQAVDNEDLVTHVQ